MIIRPEREEDNREIYNLVKLSFQSAEISNGSEADLVNMLRQGKSYISDLALVAEEDDDKLIGYIMFTKAKVGNKEILALAPLAVLPQYQNRGIGSALINKGHQKAQDLGYEYSVVLGSENYYPKFSYVPAINYGIRSPFEVDQKKFMACKLNDKAEKINGLMVYAGEFGIKY